MAVQAIPQTRIFSDIDLSMTPHPVTKDLIAKYDENAIKNAVKNLLLTRHFERPFHSEIGSSLGAMMFELATPGLVALLRSEITNVLTNFEPRVVIQDISITFSPDEHEIFVRLEFTMRNTTRPITVQFVLNRTR